MDLNPNRLRWSNDLSLWRPDGDGRHLLSCGKASHRAGVLDNLLSAMPLLATPEAMAAAGFVPGIPAVLKSRVSLPVSSGACSYGSRLA